MGFIKFNKELFQLIEFQYIELIRGISFFLQIFFHHSYSWIFHFFYPPHWIVFAMMYRITHHKASAGTSAISRPLQNPRLTEYLAIIFPSYLRILYTMPAASRITRPDSPAIANITITPVSGVMTSFPPFLVSKIVTS